MSEQFLSHNAYQKLGSAIAQLVYGYSHIHDIVNLNYRNRYKYRRSYGDDLEKIDVTPLASDLELKVFLSKENPASVEYLNEAKKLRTHLLMHVKMTIWLPMEFLKKLQIV